MDFESSMSFSGNSSVREWVDTVSEYLLARNDELDAVWPETARRFGILLCSESHVGICSVKTGCGIGNDAIRFNVMPIISVDGFDCKNFDHVLLVTLSKKNLHADSLQATSLVRDFLMCLREKGIAVFASQGQGNGRTWVTIE